MNLEQLKYPVGKYHYPEQVNNTTLSQWISIIADLPTALRQMVDNLTEEQLNWRYRPEGWTIKQVVHHLADSHLNSQTRFKWALTEDHPTIKPYHEDKWAELPDVAGPIEDSILLLTGLHNRWVNLLKGLTEDQLARTYVHPQHGKTFDLKYTIGMYAWHCQHHLAHIKQAIAHQGQFN